MSSRNVVTKAAKVLMKEKTGEDRAVLKKKLQDLERESGRRCVRCLWTDRASWRRITEALVN